MNAKNVYYSKTGIRRTLSLLLAFMLILAFIPPVQGEASSSKSKALSAYKKLLSKSTVTVIPKGKKIWNDDSEKYVTYKSSKAKNVKFAVAYIDNDSVPELILQDKNYGYGLWTYKNGKVKNITWGDTYDKAYGYYRKKGMYVEIGYSEGTPYTVFYEKLKSGKLSLKLSKFVYNVEDEETEYYIGSKAYEKEASKSAFNKKLKSYVGSTKLTKITLHSNSSSHRKKYLK